HFGWTIVVLSAIAAVVLLAALFWAGDRTELVFAVTAVAASIAMFVLYAGLRWEDSLRPVAGTNVFATDARYSVAPCLLLLSAVVVLVAHLRTSPYRLFVAGALVAVIAVTWVIDFRVTNARAAHPTWAESVRAAK